MKIFFVDLIKKYLYRIGVYIQYFPTPKHFYDFSKDKPTEVKEYELRKITANIRDVNNHKFYDGLLKLFIPDWSVNIENAKFIGKGFSQSSIKAFRKLTIENKIYFEKVYFNSYQDLETVQWFQKHIYKLVKDKVKVPPILKIYAGDTLTAIYYEYVDLIALSKEKREVSFIQISRDLYQISFIDNFYLSKLEIPTLICDFRVHFLYKRHRSLALIKLQEQGIDLKALEDSIYDSKRVLTHGDIFEGNCFEYSVLIDWDTFGIFPIGFDPAFVFHRLLVRDGKTSDALGWLKQHYQDIVLEEDWNTFEQNFVYFLYIFATNTFDKGLFKDVEQQLITQLKLLNIYKIV